MSPPAGRPPAGATIPGDTVAPGGTIVELRDLRYFLAVASTLNFREAAAGLFIGAGQLSRAISALETELGVPLFHRTTRKVELTADGRQLVPKAQDIVARADELVKSARRQSRDVPKFTVGLRSVPAALVSAFRGIVTSVFPDAELELLPARSQDQLEAIIRGDLDFGFVAGPILDERIGAMPALDDPLVVVLPDEAKFRSLDVVTPKDLAELSFAWDPDMFVDGNMARYTRASRAIYRAEPGSLGATRGLIISGTHWAFSFLDPENVWHSSFKGSGLIMRPTEDQLGYRTHLVWSNQGERSEQVSAILAAARARQRPAGLLLSAHHSATESAT